MKTTKDLFEVYRPKPKDEQKFVDKHVTIKHQDRNGNGDDVFKASKVKTSEREADRHGYEPGEDEKVYEENELEEVESLDEAVAAINRLTHSHPEAGDAIHSALSKYNNTSDAIKHVANSISHKVSGDEWNGHKANLTKYFSKFGLKEDLDEDDLSELTEASVKVGSYTPDKGETFFSLHKSDHDPKHHMLVNPNGKVVKSFYDTTENVHKECRAKGLSGSLKEDINEAREITPELRAAQKNLADLKAGKAEPKPKKKSWASHLRDYDKFHKAELNHHKEKYKYHAQNAKDTESMMHDLHSGNLGIPTDDKHWMRGAEEEIDSMLNKHLEAMEHHRQQMHYHNSFLSKPLKLKEEVEQIDEISKKTLGSYVKKAAVDLAGNSYKSGHKDGQKGPYSVTGPSRKEDNRLSGISRATDRLTKEDIINKTLAKILPEDFEPRPLEERLVESIEHLSDTMADSIMDLFVKLDEDNQRAMLDLVESDDGINELLNFVIENKDLIKEDE